MIVVLAVALAAPATPPKPAAAAAQWPACQQGKLQPVQGSRPAGVHKLNQEPPARQVYTVLRIEDGCAKPVFVNDRVIGGARR